jgi:hypothetical protein
MYNVDVNYLAVVVAAIVQMVLGALWYSPILFGKMWMKLVGMPSDYKPKGVAKSYMLMFISALIMAFVLALVVNLTGIFSIAGGVTAAFWVWIGFIATTGVSEYLWTIKPKPWTLYVLNQAYWLVSLLIMGGLLAIWV